MRILTVILLAAACAVSLNADEVAGIREYYNEVMDHLDDEYGLYRTEISINTEDGIYPALGHYQEDIVFYWDSEGGYKWLVFATWSGEYASHNEYGEVLFSCTGAPWDGDTGEEELVFQFIAFDNSDDNLAEVRWWFTGGELLQSAGKTVYSDGVEYEFEPSAPDDFDYAHYPSELLSMFRRIHD